MNRLLPRLITGNDTRTKRSKHNRRTAQFRPVIEQLEDRALLSLTAVLDFTSASISGAEMEEGGWGEFPRTTASFHSLFDGRYGHLDVNGDGRVNLNDAQATIDLIVDQVRQDYAPYAVEILVGEQHEYQHLLTDGRAGDVLVITTGDRGFLPGVGGIAPRIDAGNRTDEIVWAFGDVWASLPTITTAQMFINAMAHTISHEMGHAFGLHRIADRGQVAGETVSHHVMTTPFVQPADHLHSSGFQDISYKTVSGENQNAHRVLTSTLGASSKPWVAVLRPGELTVKGDDDGNTIEVRTSGPAEWTVVVDSTSTVVDTHNPSFDSLNPFARRLTRIHVYGESGHDTITVQHVGGVRVSAYGGYGDDVIRTGAGQDWIHSGPGDDTIYGGAGDDFISGGWGGDEIHAESGNDMVWGDQVLSAGSPHDGRDEIFGGDDDDRLIGGGGDDVLRGERGADFLNGTTGNDVLYGGSDFYLDHLVGGLGRDTFVGFFFYVVFEARDYNPWDGDRIRFDPWFIVFG